MSRSPRDPLKKEPTPDRPDPPPKHKGGKFKAGNKGGGRHPDPEVTAAEEGLILQAARGGHFRAIWAKFTGISDYKLIQHLNRVQRAVERADKKEPPKHGDDAKVRFSVMLRQAEAYPELAAVDVLARAIKNNDVPAAVRFLERRYPQRWGLRVTPETEKRNETLEVKPRAITIDITPENASKDDLLKVLAMRGIPLDFFGS